MSSSSAADPIHNAQTHPLFSPQMDRITGFVTRSVLCVPIVVKGKAIGAIEAINKIGGPFTHDDLEMLSFLAASVGVALENARLYGELAQSKQDLERSQAQLIQAEKLAATGPASASIAHESTTRCTSHSELFASSSIALTDEKRYAT
jgi:GAF domain-containing protein